MRWCHLFTTPLLPTTNIVRSLVWLALLFAWLEFNLSWTILYAISCNVSGTFVKFNKLCGFESSIIDSYGTQISNLTRTMIAIDFLCSFLFVGRLFVCGALVENVEKERCKGKIHIWTLFTRSRYSINWICQWIEGVLSRIRVSPEKPKQFGYPLLLLYYS